jgi:hypothetical protein
MSLLPVRARPNHSVDQDVSCQRLLSVDQKPSFYPIHRTWTFGKERAGGARLPDEGEQRQQQQQRRSRLVFPPAALAALVPATAFRALPHARQPMAASAPVVRRPTVRLTVTASAPAVRCPTVRQTVTASASEVRSPTVRLTVLRLTVRATAATTMRTGMMTSYCTTRSQSRRPRSRQVRTQWTRRRRLPQQHSSRREDVALPKPTLASSSTRWPSSDSEADRQWTSSLHPSRRDAHRPPAQTS